MQLQMRWWRLPLVPRAVGIPAYLVIANRVWVAEAMEAHPSSPRQPPGCPATRPALQGMEVVAAIAALPRVKDNTGSPFFQAGKASGEGSHTPGGSVGQGPNVAGTGMLLEAVFACSALVSDVAVGCWWYPRPHVHLSAYPHTTLRLASAIVDAGDKRADVAQRAFNKPFAKIVINECGFV